MFWVLSGIALAGAIGSRRPSLKGFLIPVSSLSAGGSNRSNEGLHSPPMDADTGA